MNQECKYEKRNENGTGNTGYAGPTPTGYRTASPPVAFTALATLAA